MYSTAVISPATTVNASKKPKRPDLILFVSKLAELFKLKKSLISVLHVEKGA